LLTRLAENLALGGHAVQKSTESERDAGNAIDGKTDTASCTENHTKQPWWAVDLQEFYDINSLSITLPSVSGANNDTCNYC